MKRIIFLIQFPFICFMSSCLTDNEEEVFAQEITETETESETSEDSVITYSYTLDIEPIMAENCTICHSQGTPGSAGIHIETYSKIIPYVNDGSLLGTINHDDGYSAMPSGSPQLPQVDIDIITSWINDGAKEN